MHIAAHGAQFVEVKVDEDLGIVKVTRVVEATASGKIINPKAAHSQEIGGVVWGIGMALTEETKLTIATGELQIRNSPIITFLQTPMFTKLIRCLLKKKIKSSTNSASKEWANSEWSAFRRQSPTPFFTRPANASAICRLRSINCCDKVIVLCK